MDAELPKMHWRQGRWYPVGKLELRIITHTLNGFVLEQRPYVDKDPGEGVECQSEMGSLSSPQTREQDELNRNLNS